MLVTAAILATPCVLAILGTHEKTSTSNNYGDRSTSNRVAVEVERVLAVPHEERVGVIEGRIWRMWDRPHIARARGGRVDRGRPPPPRHASVEEDRGDPRPP